MSDVSAFFDKRTSELISRPPTKIGEFDVEAAERCVADFHAKRLEGGWPICKGELLTIPRTSAVDVAKTFRFYRAQEYFETRGPAFYLRLSGFDEDYEDYDSGRQWHLDEGSDPLTADFGGVGMSESVVGATPNVTRVLEGRLKIEQTWLDRNSTIERALVDVVMSNQGQEAVEDALARGDLEPVEVIRAGDLSLIPKGAIHAEPPGLEEGLRFFSKYFMDCTVQLTRE